MVATKKRATRSKGVMPGQSAKNSSSAVAAPEQPKPERRARPRTFRIVLVEGMTLERSGHRFVSGRALITTDERLYEALKNTGRFRCDIEGGNE